MATVDENTIMLTAGGGSGGYTYSIGGQNFQAESMFVDVPNGDYTMTVRDANGCEATATATVSVNTLVVGATILSDVSCFGESDGSLSVTVSGGTAPYQYSLNGVDFQAESTFTGLPAGDYQVTVLDVEGFTRQTDILSIAEPSELTLVASVDENTIMLTAAGGSGDYTYSTDGQNFQAESMFVDVPNGDYTLTVRDANGCEAATTATILTNTLTISGNVLSDVSCFGGSDGRLSVTTSGGMPPHQYSLNGVDFQAEPTFTGLPAGDYQVMVMDADGFTQQTGIITIQEPPALELTATVTGSTITLIASGGAGGYIYSFNGQNFQPGDEFVDMPNGNYTMVVQDANGCMASVLAEVFVELLNATAMVVNQVSCFGMMDGSILINASGGTPPYQYSLDAIEYQSEAQFDGLPMGDYPTWVRDASGMVIQLPALFVSQPDPITVQAIVNVNGTVTLEQIGGTPPYQFSLDGINFQDENVFTDLVNGDYTFTVLDANGYSTTVDVIIAINTLGGEATIIENVSCAGLSDGQLLANGAGGTPPYEYSLDGENFQPENLFAGLPPGEYQVTIRDADGFIVNLSPLNLTEPEPLTIMLEVINALHVEVEGGTPPYQYSLNDGPFQAENSFSNVVLGINEVVVMDANGCSVSESTIIDNVRDLRFDLDWKLFPNPNEGNFQITLTGELVTELELMIYNALGQVVLTQNRFPVGNRLEVDAHFLPAGIYEVIVITDDGKGVKRMVVR